MSSFAEKEDIMIKLEKYKPAVTKNVLLFLAGFIWACVGTMLLFLAFTWLIKVSHTRFYLLGGAGIIFALLIHHFGFFENRRQKFRQNSSNGCEKMHVLLYSMEKLPDYRNHGCNG
jgi:cytochrome c biogenesis protein CcdA